MTSQDTQIPTQALYDAYGTEDLTLPMGELRWHRSNLDPIEQVTLLSLIALNNPRRIFELGTYDGSTTLRLARAAPQAHLWTVDLPPDEAGISTEPGTRQHVQHGHVGRAFRDTDEARRITQILADTRTLRSGDLAGTMDLVIVDAGHELEFVRSDTKLAFELRADDGVVVWDDYEPYWPDVQQAVDELDPLTKARCVHIANTGMVVYDPSRVRT